MEPFDDDKPVGRVLSRREVLALLGSAGAAMLVGGSFTKFGIDQATSTPAVTGTAALPTCVVRPEMTEGPYFVDEKLNRSDIRIDPSDGSVKDGVQLRLAFHVFQLGTNSCQPLQGAQVDVWHCDAQGVYSDTNDPGFNTTGKKFLRGYQVTGANGAAEFLTIYPGWYQGRTVHIHFKIRTDPASSAGYEFTSQLFFDDTLTDQVFTQKPYASKGQRTLRNEGDGIFQNGGSQLTLAPFKEGDGYTAAFDIALDTTQPKATVNAPGGVPGMPRRGGPPPNNQPPPSGATATPQ